VSGDGVVGSRFQRRWDVDLHPLVARHRDDAARVEVVAVTWKSNQILRIFCFFKNKESWKSNLSW
jgi:hypothetical protein